MSDPSQEEPPAAPPSDGDAGADGNTPVPEEQTPAGEGRPAEGPAAAPAASGSAGATDQRRGGETPSGPEREPATDYEASPAPSPDTNLINHQGAVAVGERPMAQTVNVHTEAGQPPVQSVEFTDTEVVEPHVRPASHPESARALAVASLVVIVARPGSGRRTTSVLLLLDHVPILNIKVLHDNGDVLQAICDQAEDLLEENHGYIVDTGTHGTSQQTLDMLSQLALAKGAFIVVIAAPEAFRDEHLWAHVVRHEGAPRDRVFAAHLRARYAAHLDRCSAGSCEQVDTYCAALTADERVREALKVAPSMDRVVQFARDLVDNVHENAERRDEIIAQWADLSQLAREILGTARGIDGETKSDAYQHAFRVSYALFHRHPLSDVIDAVPLLSDGILTSAEAREAPPPEQVFERDLNLIVPLRMRANAPVGAGPADGPRRAILVNEQLLPALLKVAWYEYGSLRLPLLIWLDRMLASESLDYERVRIRVAQIVGMLLGHDFDYVYRTVVREWARSMSGVRRQCAAWAFEMAATDEQLRSRVVARVRDWAGSPSVNFQDCAARALGTTIGRNNVGATLDELRRLGGKRDLAHRASVSSSLAGLFLLDQADPVLDALAGWHRSDNQHLRRHSVRTMLRLGGLAHLTRPRGRPVLADVAVRAPERRELLLDLWKSALTRQETSARAWFLLGKWLLAADTDEADDRAELLDAYGEITEMIAATPIRDRLVFNLRLWAGRHPQSATVRTIGRTVDPGFGAFGPFNERN